MSEPKTAEVKVVPVEPTEAMIDAVMGVSRGYGDTLRDSAPEVWSAMLAASPPAKTGEGFTSLDGLWKNPALSRLERVKAHRSEFGSDLKTALEAVNEESGRQSIAAAAQPVSPSEGEAVAAVGDLRHCIAVASQEQPGWRDVWEAALAAVLRARLDAGGKGAKA